MNEFDHLSDDEKLKAENAFLKLKLMAENGAMFGSASNLPPDIENQFLNNVAAFEREFANHKTIKVFDKLGKPNHFKSVSEIPDSQIEQAWRELDDYMQEYGIDLSVCIPNISVRELYRFTTEELFEHETDDMNLPGMFTNFIYDEFHPDPIYENSRLVKDELFRSIFKKDEMIADYQSIHYLNEGFTFNGILYNVFSDY